MIISPGRRYIFVHVPKTGGTALALGLEARAMKDDILIGDTPKARRRRGRLAGLTAAGRLWKHSGLADIEGVVAREAFDRFLIFTLVRNPWDRLVSHYHWLRDQTFDHPAVVLAQRLEFSGFLNHPAIFASFRSHSVDSYLTDGAGQVRSALFIRLEHVQADMDPLADHLGFRPEMGHVNRSERQADWRRYYNDRDSALVARLFARDIARFGYRFDP